MKAKYLLSSSAEIFNEIKVPYENVFKKMVLNVT